MGGKEAETHVKRLALCCHLRTIIDSDSTQDDNEDEADADEEEGEDAEEEGGGGSAMISAWIVSPLCSRRTGVEVEEEEDPRAAAAPARSLR